MQPGQNQTTSHNKTQALVQPHSANFPWSWRKICERQHFKAYRSGADAHWRTEENMYDGFQTRIFKKLHLGRISQSWSQDEPTRGRDFYLVLIWFWEGGARWGLAGGQEVWRQWTQLEVHYSNCTQSPGKAQRKLLWGKHLLLTSESELLRQLAMWHVNTKTKVSKGRSMETLDIPAKWCPNNVRQSTLLEKLPRKEILFTIELN